MDRHIYIYIWLYMYLGFTHAEVNQLPKGLEKALLNPRFWQATQESYEGVLQPEPTEGVGFLGVLLLFTLNPKP